MAENHTPRVTGGHSDPVSAVAHHGACGTTVVTLRGEIDMLTAPALSARLDMLTAASHFDLVLDLRTVAFIDCAGLGVLCRARNRVHAGQGRLRLVTGDTSFLHLLRVTGLRNVFEVHPQLPRPLPQPDVSPTRP
ncbi:STAS domain-containing protein [Streptomyces sp. FXJ1.172]|uniref:STAS domain-containing protein n=1 Tax=Streptomyces sp. FXJ1.172 TaxID=710705 RepID=UPI0007CFC37F|nr:STAS domain-containing protein [Streptomyces sp. FXJ1.172]WEO99698.1 STAS domain-containing protein [Streptomyces sp. FXJ1.172]